MLAVSQVELTNLNADEFDVGQLDALLTDAADEALADCNVYSFCTNYQGSCEMFGGCESHGI